MRKIEGGGAGRCVGRQLRGLDCRLPHAPAHQRPSPPHCPAPFLPAPLLLRARRAGWLSFIIYVNPLAYSLRALANNEFRSPPYQIYTNGSSVPLGSQYLSFMTLQEGAYGGCSGVGAAWAG